MACNVTFNNISDISWWSVLLVEETGVPGENHASTYHKSLTNFITWCCIEYTSPERNSFRSQCIALIAYTVVNSITTRSRPRRATWRKEGESKFKMVFADYPSKTYMKLELHCFLSFCFVCIPITRVGHYLVL